jgi:NAD dependent epimerase/dehydratase family enzyme
MSWVTLADWTGAARFLLDHQEISGPVNLTAPVPETNAAFTAALAGALHRPALLSIPSPVLTMALGEVTSDLMASARVLPRVLREAGYGFTQPDLRAALSAELQPAGSAA